MSPPSFTERAADRPGDIVRAAKRKSAPLSNARLFPPLCTLKGPPYGAFHSRAASTARVSGERAGGGASAAARRDLIFGLLCPLVAVVSSLPGPVFHA
jgi:hypothetical protein